MSRIKEHFGTKSTALMEKDGLFCLKYYERSIYIDSKKTTSPNS